jgi:hypothetical protein
MKNVYFDWQCYTVSIQSIKYDSGFSTAGEKAVSTCTFKSKPCRFSIHIPEVPVCSRRKGHSTGCGKLTSFFEYEMPYEKGS